MIEFSYPTARHSETDRGLRSLRLAVLRPHLLKDRQVIDPKLIDEAVGSHPDVDCLPAPVAPPLRLRQRVEFDRAVRAGRVREGARLVAHR